MVRDPGIYLLSVLSGSCTSTAHNYRIRRGRPSGGQWGRWLAATHKLAIWLDPVPRVRATQYRTAGCPTTSIRWFRARKLLSRSRKAGELEKLDDGGCGQRCLVTWALVFARRFHKKHINSNWQQLHRTARWAFSGSSPLTHSKTSVWESDELAKEKEWGPSVRVVCLSTRGKCTKGNTDI